MTTMSIKRIYRSHRTYICALMQDIYRDCEQAKHWLGYKCAPGNDWEKIL